MAGFTMDQEASFPKDRGPLFEAPHDNIFRCDNCEGEIHEVVRVDGPTTTHHSHWGAAISETSDTYPSVCKRIH